MTFRLTASVGGVRRFTGAVTGFASGAPLGLSSFSPAQAPVGTTITLYGSGFASGMAVRFNGGALLAGTVTIVSANQATVAVPVGAATGTLQVVLGGGTVTSATPFTVGALLATDSFATLPTRQPRYSSLPPARNGVASHRIVRLTTSATWQQLKDAITTVSAFQNEGTCWVLIPEGTDIVPPGIQSPIAGPAYTVAPAFPICIANEQWFDGGRVYSSGAMLTKAQADAQPTIRPCRVTTATDSSAEYDPWARWTSRSDIVCIGVRMLDTPSGIGYTRECFASGDTYTTNGVGDNVGHAVFWWCATGMQQNSDGKPFTASGHWRTGMGRAFTINGSGFATRNCYHYGHGAVGSQGSDRGYVGGWTSSGPWLIKGCNVKNPGGIGTMHGGAGHAPGIVLHDWTIEDNVFERTDPWNADDPVNRWLDAAGLPCPYTSKNIHELKEVRQFLAQRNLFLNDYALGQQYAIVIKSSWQGSHGTDVGSNDITYRQNIVTSRNKGVFSFSVAEGETADATYNGVLLNPTGAAVLGMVRVSMHDNVFVARSGLPSVNGFDSGQANLVLLTREARGSGNGTPPVIVGRQPEKFDFSRNLCWIYEIGTAASSRGVIMNGVNGAKPLPQWVMAHNIFGASPAPGGGSGMTYLWRNEGLDLDGARLDRLSDYTTRTDAFPSATIGRNMFIGVPTGLNGGVPTAQIEWANAAAAGLVVTSPTQFSYVPASPLADEGAKPDLVAVMAVRDALLAGVV